MHILFCLGEEMEERSNKKRKITPKHFFRLFYTFPANTQTHQDPREQTPLVLGVPPTRCNDRLETLWHRVEKLGTVFLWGRFPLSLNDLPLILLRDFRVLLHQASLEITPEVFYGAESGTVGRPGDHGVLLFSKVPFDHLGSMDAGNILLEDDTFELLEVVVNGVLELLSQDPQVGVRVDPFWERTGPPNSLGGQAAPDLKGTTPELHSLLHKPGLQVLILKSPDISPSHGLMEMEGGLVRENHRAPEVGGLLGVFIGPLQPRFPLRWL